MTHAYIADAVRTPRGKGNDKGSLKSVKPAVLLALTGTVDAARLALARAGLDVNDIDLFEINEGFAAVALHFMDQMQVGHDRVNVNGGSIAIGHAMGATGAAMISVCLDELELRQARYACASICGAAGVASAMVLERLH